MATTRSVLAFGTREGNGGWFVGRVLRDEVAAEGAGQDAAFQVVEKGEGAGGFLTDSLRAHPERN
ncbi:hypothetical protein [Roseicella frigidaeris]|nr:hypothetical protein [Roseicella frigidaeris]